MAHLKAVDSVLARFRFVALFILSTVVIPDSLALRAVPELVLVMASRHCRRSLSMMQRLSGRDIMELESDLVMEMAVFPRLGRSRFTTEISPRLDKAVRG
jgi:hypothetical protein